MARVERAKHLWLWMQVLLCAVWMSATSARASDLMGFTWSGPCLELRVREADLVVIVEPIAGGGAMTKDSVVRRVRIREVLKGNASGDIDIACGHSSSLGDREKQPERLILFLRTRGEPIPALAHEIVVRPNAARERTADLRVLCEEEELKAAIREEAARKATGAATIELPCPPFGPDSPLGLKERVVVVVPADLVTFTMAQRWARHSDPNMRLAAVSALAAIATPSANDLLIELLKDPFIDSYRDSGGAVVSRGYPVRGAAWVALETAGVLVSRPVIQEPDDLFRPVRLKPAAWVPLAVLAGLAALYRVFKGASQWRPIPLRITRRLCQASVAFALVCLLLWLASFWRIDIVTTSAGSERTEICSNRGRFAIARFSLFYGSTARPASGWASFSLADGWGDVWAFPLRADHGESKRFLGLFRSARAASNSCIYDWRSLTLPYPLLAALPPLYAFALHMLTARILRLVYAWRRICWTCGYDMRATPERCPECGTVIPGNVPTPARVLQQLREQEREEREMRQAEEKYHDALAAALDQMAKKDEP